MQSEMVAEAAMAKVKTEIQSLQDLKFAGLTREVEGLKTDLDKVKNEIRYEVDKVTAGQRLDLNLERGRIKEEITAQTQELSSLSNKMDREVNTLKAELEGAKFEIIRYCIGTLVSGKKEACPHLSPAAILSSPLPEREPSTSTSATRLQMVPQLRDAI
ncbi:unnamed protein product [Closterium sp. NIES-54]